MVYSSVENFPLPIWRSGGWISYELINNFYATANLNVEFWLDFQFLHSLTFILYLFTIGRGLNIKQASISVVIRTVKHSMVKRVEDG